MGKFAEKWGKLTVAIKNDVNLNRAGRGIRRGAKAFPRATGRYVLDRMPIVRWLPKYSPQWVVNDAVAGTTMGMMLIPQAIIFAALAGISPGDGLLASWLPPVIYTIMGTSKGKTHFQNIEFILRAADVSTGPTSTTALLTGAVISSLKDYQISPLLVLPGVTFSVGFLALLMGVFNFGWILDFMSLPIVIGFMLADGIITAQAQAPILLGLSNVRVDFLGQGQDILRNLNLAQPLSITIGVSTIIFLIILQLLGKRFGNRHIAIEMFTSCRYALAIIAFTGLSYALNQNKSTPLWAITNSIPEDLQIPKQLASLQLAAVVGLKSVPVFFAAAIEHLAVAKALGRQNGYEINPSTELTYLGVTNIANGFFGGMPVGGTLSRTAVNSGSNVKSPLSGLFTTATVLLGIFSLRNAFFYIPQPTIAAVTIVATVQVLPPMSSMAAHWKGSFIDFMSSLMITQLGLVASLNTGVGMAVFFVTVYTLIRTRWGGAEFVDQRGLDIKFGKEEVRRGIVVQAGICVVRFKDNVFFLNASRVRRVILKGLERFYERVPGWQKTRLWCEKKEGGKEDDTHPLSRTTSLRVLVLDFCSVSFVDTTTMSMLTDLKKYLKSFAYEGSDVEMRFVGLCKEVKERFERCGWKLIDGGAPGGGDGMEGDRFFEDLRSSIEFPLMGRGAGDVRGNTEWDFGFDEDSKNGTGARVRFIGF